jgi:hypothetical protein
MNRKLFLKKLGIGLGVAIIAPKVLAETKPTTDKVSDWNETKIGDMTFYSKPLRPEWTNESPIDVHYKQGWFVPNDVVQNLQTGTKYLITIPYYENREKFHLVPLDPSYNDITITNNDLHRNYVGCGNVLRKFN